MIAVKACIRHTAQMSSADCGVKRVWALGALSQRYADTLHWKLPDTVRYDGTGLQVGSCCVESLQAERNWLGK